MAKFISTLNSKLPQIRQKFVFPERYKGTFVERWANYWKHLFGDYRLMVSDFVVDIQQKPKKALIIATGLGVAWQLAQNNPDETDFKEDYLRYSNELLQVGESCQNPNTVKHFKYLGTCMNENVLRRASFGIFSLMWVDDYDEDCGLFKTRCEYTQPSYLSVLQRTVDIGVMGKWWNVYRKFHDFDVNVNNL